MLRRGLGEDEKTGENGERERERERDRKRKAKIRQANWQRKDAERCSDVPFADGPFPKLFCFLKVVSSPGLGKVRTGGN